MHYRCISFHFIPFDFCSLNKETYRQAKSLANLSPEIQQLIEQGTISPSTAARLVAKLSPKEQEILIANLPATQNIHKVKCNPILTNLNKQRIDSGKYTR